MAKFIRFMEEGQINSITLINIDFIETVSVRHSDQHNPPYAEFCFLKLVNEPAEYPLGITYNEFTEIIGRLNSGESNFETVHPGAFDPSLVH